jgi:hypothetical protein
VGNLAFSGSVEVQEGNLHLTTLERSGSVEVQEGNLRLTTLEWSDLVEVQYDKNHIFIDKTT